MLQAHDCSIVASQQVVNSNIMARFSVIFALLLVCTGVFASVEYAHFEKWISERGIEVKNPDKAWSVWKENVEFVYRHNSLGLSYKLALNDFAHLVSIIINPMRFDMTIFISDSKRTYWRRFTSVPSCSPYLISSRF